MQGWRLTLSYDGGRFHGWQVQPGLPTVQGTLANAIAHVTGERVLPQGSGRTDTGVHALGQVASFALTAPIPPGNLQRALNRVLPPSIRILHADLVPESFHARHSARQKTYEYRVFQRHTGQNGQPERICPPFLAPYVFDYRRALDIRLLERGARLIVGEHDFTSFAASDPDRADRIRAASGKAPDHHAEAPGNVRSIFSSSWQVHAEGTQLHYQVTGTGFLHHMVRNLVGTFLEIGSGRRDPASIPGILAARDRAAAGPTAPGHGLFLVEVVY